MYSFFILFDKVIFIYLLEILLTIIVTIYFAVCAENKSFEQCSMSSKVQDWLLSLRRKLLEGNRFYLSLFYHVRSSQVNQIDKLLDPLNSPFFVNCLKSMHFKSAFFSLNEYFFQGSTMTVLFKNRIILIIIIAVYFSGFIWHQWLGILI